jgi:hypothetical protein
MVTLRVVVARVKGTYRMCYMLLDPTGAATKPMTDLEAGSPGSKECERPLLPGRTPGQLGRATTPIGL